MWSSELYILDATGWHLDSADYLAMCLTSTDTVVLYATVDPDDEHMETDEGNNIFGLEVDKPSSGCTG